MSILYHFFVDGEKYLASGYSLSVMASRAILNHGTSEVISFSKSDHFRQPLIIYPTAFLTSSFTYEISKSITLPESSFSGVATITGEGMLSRIILKSISIIFSHKKPERLFY